MKIYKAEKKLIREDGLPETLRDLVLKIMTKKTGVTLLDWEFTKGKIVIYYYKL